MAIVNHIYVGKGDGTNMDTIQALEKTVFPVLPHTIAALLRGVPPALLAQATEIRLRVNQPLLLGLGATDVMLTPAGQPTGRREQAYCCCYDDLIKTLQLISKNSLYAFEQELKLGFITIAGGHRVGLAGQVIVHDGTVKALKNATSMNIRLAREVKGCADPLMPYLIGPDGRLYSTLLISPPRCGKTTLLRDIIRQLSSGVRQLNFSGVQVGLVDERSEIAACVSGVPTMDLGPRVDVLDGCPKASGLLMLLRSMAPQVLVTDELGRGEDAAAIQEALHAGVVVVATVHGRDIAGIAQRPYVGELIKNGWFDRYVILSDTPTVGTIEQVIAAADGRTLYRRPKEVRVCG
ncbi:AAA ATPase [Thermosinus carboxydivorans Nor1]|uniref:AAA ATPase n=2 Tax=Thermosinus TaxID=261684 RepID=A1HQ78_9FIRM|nr:AAA ATPase [Thermosinus carboxydivorans Nor1]